MASADPRGTPYWFESASDDSLVAVRFSAKSLRDPDERINYTERKFSADGQQPAERPTKPLEGQYVGAPRA